jgi:imidazoleglycerol phosphate dehydratase HisB
VSPIERRTRETEILGELSLDGSGSVAVATGIGFLDHLLKDCALAIGGALDAALGDRGSIARFGWAYAPLDEALARSVVDLSGRPWAEISLGLERDSIGRLACENVDHFLTSLATAGRCALHVDLLRGRNDHHRAEAAFKATALAMRQAVALTSRGDVPSTKGVLV